MNIGVRARLGRIACLVLLVVIFSGLAPLAPVEAATQIDILGPAGSDEFGDWVSVLPNGNFVVVAPLWDSTTAVDVGAVYLYDGVTAALISTMTGSHAEDHVGSGSVSILANGHWVISSPSWNEERGAATWCSSTTGCSGAVSADNSLVGTTADDRVGEQIVALSGGAYVAHTIAWDNPGVAVDAGAATWCPGTEPCVGAVSEDNSLVGAATDDKVGVQVTALSNGHYVVGSRLWHGEVGAATWGSGTAGVTGEVSAANSLVGTTAGDWVGYDVAVLTTGAYVVLSPDWDNPGTAAKAPLVNVGAVRRCSGTTTCSGAVSVSNSLVGSHAEDRVGYGATALPGGDYVVKSPYWNGEQGAATWCSGASGCKGSVSADNSLVGSHAGDRIGAGVDALAKGNYVVHTEKWNEDRGAITWCNGATGCTGTVSALNSLVGSAAGDQVGDTGALLTNGHYVVGSPAWSGGKGAATWCSGVKGCKGSDISASNSLVGSVAGDQVGNSITALTNGHYVVQSPYFKLSMGAATWGNGAAGVTGEVTAGNSLVGSTAGDEVGLWVTALTNGHYVVSAPEWDNGAEVDAGSATWCDGRVGCAGTVSAANSLVGDLADDQVGTEVTALTNGHYVVASPFWNSSSAADAGAVTWCDGTSGCTGTPSIDNSLVGEQLDDMIGVRGASPLPNGHYAVINSCYDWGATADAGAVTPGFGWGSMTGAITADNSVRGAAAARGEDLQFDYDPVNHQFIVGRPGDNMVTLFRWAAVYLPAITRGF